MKVSKNDDAWNRLFDDLEILTALDTHQHFTISSKQINHYREARLMTKFDHASHLPQIFQQNNLSILPISRGDYVIGTFDLFQTLKASTKKPIYIPFPTYIETIDYENITSESTAINCAFIAGIYSDFLKESHLYPTVNGRMGSGEFQFNITASGINSFQEVMVKNAQIEIDAGFETSNSLVLIEAKNALSKDFLIRQLYYPYRLWAPKTQKKIRPIFQIYSNGIFHLYEYAFKQENHYNSLQLIRSNSYTFTPIDISQDEIQQILASPCQIENPDITFPQADSLERIINLCELLYVKHSMTAEEITVEYDFNSRQTNYYTDGAIYLNWVVKKKEDSISYTLSPLGKKYFKMPLREKQLYFIKSILSHQVFRDSFELSLKLKRLPSKEAIINLMTNNTLTGVKSDSTRARRSSSILGWLKWIFQNIEPIQA